MIPSSLKFPLTFDALRLQADVEKFAPEDWAAHFNSSVYDGDWSGIALRAVKGAKVNLYPDPTATEGYIETEMMARCEYVPQVLEAFKCDLMTVRFLKLAAGSVIRKHRDYAMGFEDGEIRVHIPVFTNPEVEFILDEKRLEMNEGEAWYLNVNYHHSVRNDGKNDRVHLVIDCVVNDWVREIFTDSIGKAS